MVMVVLLLLLLLLPLAVAVVPLLAVVVLLLGKVLLLLGVTVLLLLLAIMLLLIPLLTLLMLAQQQCDNNVHLFDPPWTEVSSITYSRTGCLPTSSTYLDAPCLFSTRKTSRRRRVGGGHRIIPSHLKQSRITPHRPIIPYPSRVVPYSGYAWLGEVFTEGGDG